MTKLTRTAVRVEEGLHTVKEGVGRMEGGMLKIDKDVRGIARAMRESLVHLENLLAPSYAYPHLVEVKELQSKGKKSLRDRLRGTFVKDMTLHFLCPFDMSRVPCGVGGDGYPLHKTRGWVKKLSPALQVRRVLCETWPIVSEIAGSDVGSRLSCFWQRHACNDFPLAAWVGAFSLAKRAVTDCCLLLYSTRALVPRWP